MLKLTSGRIVYFEGIVAIRALSEGVQITLANQEVIDLAGITVEEFNERRATYFGELAIKGKVTEEFGTKVVAKLQKELEQTIETLQTATLAYNASAELANAASHNLKHTSDQVDSKAVCVFNTARDTLRQSADRFSVAVSDIRENTLQPTMDKFQKQVKILEEELKFTGE